jgi:hypothetical protein
LTVDAEVLEQVLRNDGYTTRATQEVDGEKVEVWQRQYLVTGGLGRVTIRQASRDEIEKYLTGGMAEEHLAAVLRQNVVHWHCRLEVGGQTVDQVRPASKVLDLHAQFLKG